MGTFKTFIDSKGIKNEDLVHVSNSREAWGNAGRKLLAKRVAKRRGEDKDKKYAELNLAKPTAGRGVSLHQVEAAIEGKPQPRKVRSKLFKAVNEVLKAKKQGEVTDFKLLFEGTTVQKGKAPKAAKAAAAKK
ncbi:MAG: hypothetical protein IPJ65_34205 [Archangiaceae bacterium]|nr:hypothetical protein [Archangiaceae bacterium]